MKSAKHSEEFVAFDLDHDNEYNTHAHVKAIEPDRTAKLLKFASKHCHRT